MTNKPNIDYPTPGDFLASTWNFSPFAVDRLSQAQANMMAIFYFSLSVQNRNGGSDGTRTRGLLRDRQAF